MSSLGLDPERLSSLDSQGHKKNLIPAEARGRYRRRRNLVYAVLLLFFLALPWVHLGGEQLLLLDIGRREFHIFGLTLFAHDAPLIFFVIAIFALGLALSTAVWGRIWCGWACPQTVFIDFVYRRLEIWIEGPYLERRRLEAAPMSLEKFLKRTAKWAAFFAVSALFAHSLAALFIGSQPLIEMMGKDPTENWSYFLTIMGFASVLTFNFGWFREQFCIIMCPYGRLQSLLMDSTSLSVVYDVKRGEPRKSPGATGPQGDCVSCRRCVEVCPVGIDIRKGLQLECIACTACMDACDEIMTKVKKPTGLIRYSNVRGTTWRFFKPRALLYSAFLIFSASALAWSLAGRGDLEAVLLRAKGLPYQIVNENSTAEVTNQFQLHLKNQRNESQTWTLSLTGEGATLVVPSNPVVLEPRQDFKFPLFIKFSAASSPPRELKLRLTGGESVYEIPIHLMGPNDGK